MTNIITLSELFLAVCAVENPNGILGVHPDGVSYGVAGITAGCLQDVNHTLGTEYTLGDMDNPAKAYLVFAAYTKLRCDILELEFSPENRARVFHGASHPIERARYWGRVQEELEWVCKRNESKGRYPEPRSAAAVIR